jgi:hypothetical protein
MTLERYGYIAITFPNLSRKQGESEQPTGQKPSPDRHGRPILSRRAIASADLNRTTGGADLDEFEAGALWRYSHNAPASNVGKQEHSVVRDMTVGPLGSGVGKTVATGVRPHPVAGERVLLRGVVAVQPRPCAWGSDQYRRFCHAPAASTPNDRPFRADGSPAIMAAYRCDVTLRRPVR